MLLTLTMKDREKESINVDKSALCGRRADSLLELFHVDSKDLLVVNEYPVIEIYNGYELCGKIEIKEVK